MSDVTLRAAGLIYPGLLLFAVAVLVVQLVAEGRRQRRTAARLAERAARPHSVNAGTAQQDAAALTLQAIREQCEDWARPTTAVTYTSRVRDNAVAGAAGLLLDLIHRHDREQRRA
ncbi:hypothetical protein [Streptomyces marianii]|uniref:Uncharacterized protein n=1 Tax=Streptomyces marianii TaxID=1817406 RepID=A0A5R9E331_9ACTN|nr:hypothetical protein [Streptomyces marianii]TLQ43465.1 hypothetical protein FEF34_10195 [Streptomyces marianii]